MHEARAARHNVQRCQDERLGALPLGRVPPWRDHQRQSTETRSNQRGVPQGARADGKQVRRRHRKVAKTRENATCVVWLRAPYAASSSRSVSRAAACWPRGAAGAAQSAVATPHALAKRASCASPAASSAHAQSARHSRHRSNATIKLLLPNSAVAWLAASPASSTSLACRDKMPIRVALSLSELKAARWSGRAGVAFSVPRVAIALRPENTQQVPGVRPVLAHLLAHLAACEPTVRHNEESFFVFCWFRNFVCFRRHRAPNARRSVRRQRSHTHTHTRTRFVHIPGRGSGASSFGALCERSHTKIRATHHVPHCCAAAQELRATRAARAAQELSHV